MDGYQSSNNVSTWSTISASNLAKLSIDGSRIVDFFVGVVGGEFSDIFSDSSIEVTAMLQAYKNGQLKIQSY